MCYVWRASEGIRLRNIFTVGNLQNYLGADNSFLTGMNTGLWEFLQIYF